MSRGSFRFARGGVGNSLTLVLVVLAVALAACSDTTTGPGPEPAAPISASQDPPDPGEIRDLIDDLLDGGNQTAALRQFRNVERQFGRGEVEDAIDKTFALVDFLFARLAAGQTNEPPGAAGVAELVGLLFAFVELPSPAIDPDILTGDRDGAVQIVGPAGGVVVTAAGFAAAEIPAGALDDDALIVIGRLPVPCLPTNLDQQEGCYEYLTIPPLDQINPSGLFNVDVQVEVCLLGQTLGQPDADEFLLHKFDPNNPQAGVVVLPDVQENTVVCSSFVNADRGFFGSLAGLVGRGWQRMFGALPLHAADRGLGGLVRSFSNIGWARAATMSILSGDGQSAPEFSTIQIGVKLETTHPVTAPFAGATVDFLVTGGGGSVVSSGVTTAAGELVVDWTLGAAGPQTLEASGPGTGSPLVFNATATSTGPIQSSFGSAYIDGVIDLEEEWAGATVIPMSGGTLDQSTLYIMNDGSSLYIGFEVFDTALTGDDLLNIRFDSTNDDVAQAGDDEFQASPASGFVDTHFDGSFWGVTDSSNDGEAAFSNVSNITMIEVRKSLFSEDGDDFNLVAGDVVGICVRFFDAGTAVGSFPSGCMTAGLDLTGYLDIQIVSPPIQ